MAETLNEASPAPHDKDATEPRLQHLESNLATYHVNGSNIIAGESGDEDGVLNDEAAAGGLPSSAHTGVGIGDGGAVGDSADVEASLGASGDESSDSEDSDGVPPWIDIDDRREVHLARDLDAELQKLVQRANRSEKQRERRARKHRANLQDARTRKGRAKAGTVASKRKPLPSGGGSGSGGGVAGAGAGAGAGSGAGAGAGAGARGSQVGDKVRGQPGGKRGKPASTKGVTLPGVATASHAGAGRTEARLPNSAGAAARSAPSSRHTGDGQPGPRSTVADAGNAGGGGVPTRAKHHHVSLVKEGQASTASPTRPPPRGVGARSATVASGHPRHARMKAASAASDGAAAQGGAKVGASLGAARPKGRAKGGKSKASAPRAPERTSAPQREHQPSTAPSHAVRSASGRSTASVGKASAVSSGNQATVYVVATGCLVPAVW